MGIISVERADSLFWLGRYTERVFTTVKVFFDYYDRMIDRNEMAYKRFCEKLSIPDVYADADDFSKNYVVDEDNPDSIISNLRRAYDNAIVSRDDISTDSMSYLELSLMDIKKSRSSVAPLLELQSVIDNIYAFWGSIDDCILDEESRNLVKCGRYVERIDMYLRLAYSYEKVHKEFLKFCRRIERVKIHYSEEKFLALKDMMDHHDAYEENRLAMLSVIQQIFN